MTSVSSMIHSGEQEPKESTNKIESAIVPGQNKHNTVGTSHYDEPLRRNYIKEDSLISSLHNQLEGIDSKVAPRLFRFKARDVANRYSPFTAPFYLKSQKNKTLPRFDDYSKIFLRSDRLDKARLRYHSSIDVLKELQYFQSKLRYVTSGFVSPSSLTSALSPIPKTSQTYLFLTRLTKMNKVDKVILSNMPKPSSMSVIPKFSKTKQNPKSPNDDDQIVKSSFTTSSVIIFSEGVQLLTRQTVTVLEEDNGGILNGTIALSQGKNADNDQTILANSAFAVTYIKGLEARPPMRHLRYWLQHSTQYECRHCGILYVDEDLYDLHMYAHGMGDPFTCVCGQTFPGGKGDFNVHLLTDGHILPVRFQNPEPAAPYPRLEAFSNDRTVYWFTHVEPFVCNQCKILYTDFAIFMVHKFFHHSDYLFICTCEESIVYYDSYRFNAHLFVSDHSRPFSSDHLLQPESDLSDSDESD